MGKNQRNSGTSPARQQLLRLFQQLNFGRIERLRIQDGEPVLSPAPKRIREFKPGSDNEPRPEANSPDHLLKRQITDLFGYFDHVQSGIIDVIEIKHGLPFKLEHAETPA